MSRIVVAALYHFAPLPDPRALRAPLLALCEAEGIRGSVLLAREGINGTIAGPRTGIDLALAHIRAIPGLAALEHKESAASDMPFGRMKVLLKREIVSMGQPDVDPRAGTGRYVDPSDWNALVSAPDVAVIDTRNAYEVAIGSFEGAIDPGNERFRDFPAWWAANCARFAGKRIAMFCTGGIRCEKSTNFLIGQGVEEVYHLRGGILKYLEEVPEAESLWRGACFVFDRRVSVEHGLREGPHLLCHACRRPLAPADRAHPAYEEGVACHHCTDEYSEAARARFRERQRQVELAARRGRVHLGTTPGP
ncbi:hypothetical protein DDZ14_09965 [Maritimibacter sp. 55A14]|uniref:oxygen-dependent tRNA uridine(34) hydroxylase TrhO n=1 Tax=Maritimibacter sp. 55A14 TaxID=2174844 RepID=UPI000D60B025|nr:rhodanese-related sulfurtransferase [Maritimibacter sp. 55A14]PWE32386.1 hypothetical protein DDZ14_09965 [Maritimibacter sp. 55A14]